jgi:putative transposase
MYRGCEEPAPDARSIWCARPRLVQQTPRESFDPDSLWREAKPLVTPRGGVLVVDDSTLDKPYAKKRIELVTQHWSGKHHHQVVWGINLITLLWTDGEKLVPCDFRVYDKPMGFLGPFGGKDKNEHLDMLTGAKGRVQARLRRLRLLVHIAQEPQANPSESRLALVRQDERQQAGQPDRKIGNLPLGTVEIPSEGRVVHLKAYGFARVFKTASPKGDVEYYYATSDVEMVVGEECDDLAAKGWGIEVYHRGIKQCCGVERSQVRDAIKQLSHISLSLRAFLRLERERIRHRVSWYESKISIIRGAISSYLASPTLGLTRSA